jgi:hypothetical protein
MLLRDNLGKLLVKNWTDFIDVHLLTNFVKEFVKNKNFSETEIDDISYHRRAVSIKVGTANLHPSGLEILVNFTVPQTDSYIAGTLELILTLDGKTIVNDFAGVVVKSKKYTDLY